MRPKNKTFYITDQSSNAMSSCHKAFAVVCTSSERSKQYLEFHAGTHNCITIRNIILTTSNKLLHIVPCLTFLSVAKSVFAPILTCGHESWAITERVLSQVQAVEMRFLPRVHGVTLCDKVRNCEILQSLQIPFFKSHFFEKRDLNYDVSVT